MEYKKLETYGQKPSKRINSTLHFDGVSAFLFLIGGRALYSSNDISLTCNLYGFNL